MLPQGGDGDGDGGGGGGGGAKRGRRSARAIPAPVVDPDGDDPYRIVPARTRVRGARVVLAAAAGIACALLLALAFYALLLVVPALAAILFVLALPFVPVALASRRLLKIRAVVLAGGVALVPMLAPEVVHQANASVEVLARRIDREGPIAGLGPVERSGIYLAGLARVAGGFLAGHREAAREHLYLYRHGPEVRRFDGDLAMASDKVRAPLAELAGRVDDQVPQPRAWALAPRTISFDHERDPKRVVLALDPMSLAAEARREGTRWRIDVVGRVDVKYPRRGRVPLGQVRGAVLTVEEGLFWALQERGWLHPYVAEWRWTVWSDDPRLGLPHPPR
jgi:hypothetical protein